MSCLITSLSSQGASNFGNFLTGIAALTALLLTIWTATRGIKIWKHQVVEKAKAEVAGRVAVAVIRLFQAMSHVTNPMTYTAKDSEKENGPHKRTYQMRGDLEQRLRETSADLSKFYIAMNEAQVFLPDDVNSKLEELAKLWHGIIASFQTYMMLLDEGESPKTSAPYFERVFGQSGVDTREALFNELKRLLRPLARME